MTCLPAVCLDCVPVCEQPAAWLLYVVTWWRGGCVVWLPVVMG